MHMIDTAIFLVIVQFVLVLFLVCCAFIVVFRQNRWNRKITQRTNALHIAVLESINEQADVINKRITEIIEEEEKKDEA